MAPLLLISVRSAAEAREAIVGGADIIDVKEPSRGPLGAADMSTLLEIADVVKPMKPLSAALGELANIDLDQYSPDLLTEYRWLKFGMAGCENLSDSKQRWLRLADHFDRGQKVVAAAYADYHLARSQPPQAIARALPLKDSIFLLDTFAKDGRSVFDIISREELLTLHSEVRTCGARFALAGSLRIEQMERIVECAPDIVGVRGAVCVSGRNGQVDAAKVSAFRDAMRRAFSAYPHPLQATV